MGKDEVSVSGKILDASREGVESIMSSLGWPLKREHFGSLEYNDGETSVALSDLQETFVRRPGYWFQAWTDGGPDAAREIARRLATALAAAGLRHELYVCFDDGTEERISLLPP
ncbi:MAG: hypothetical protein K8H88_09040 [Sandaracinaceae bacterium]|nr:hypothetical protein [Sandaracinaceae bacterium]